MAISAPPIDPSYKPQTGLKKLPVTTSLPTLLSTLSHDGALILTNLATPSTLSAIEDELQPHIPSKPTISNGALAIIPPETLVIPGLVGKSPTVASLCEHSVLDALRSAILRETYSIIREDVIEQHAIEPLLSISCTLNIGCGAPRQKLHRDDNVHGVRHGGKFKLARASQFGVLVAASETTRQNGATMVIPGSHRWDDERRPRPSEVCFAEMQPGDALVFLASCYHGGGANLVPGAVRKVHGLFFVRGTLRTEENQFLAVPRSKVLGMSPKMLSLLGYTKPTTALGIVDNEDAVKDLEGVLERASR